MKGAVPPQRVALHAKVFIVLKNGAVRESQALA